MKDSLEGIRRGLSKRPTKKDDDKQAVIRQSGATSVKDKDKKKTPQLRISKNVYRKKMLMKTSTLFSYIVISLLLVYLCFAMTILRVIPTTTSAGFIPVKNLTAPGGIAPKNYKLVVNTKAAQGDDITSRAKQALFMNNDAAVVRVEAGPFGRIQWTPTGLTSVEGKMIPLPVITKPSGEYLNNEYIVECLSGSCIKGTAFIVSAKNIYGEPLS